MKTFLAVTALWAMSIGLMILVMIYGWGVTPRSWWWIIGCGIGGRMLLQILETISKADSK